MSKVRQVSRKAISNRLCNTSESKKGESVTKANVKVAVARALRRWIYVHVPRLSKKSCSLKHRGSSAKTISWMFIHPTKAMALFAKVLRKSCERFLQRFTLLTGNGRLWTPFKCYRPRNHSVTYVRVSIAQSLHPGIRCLCPVILRRWVPMNHWFFFRVQRSGER